MHLDFQIPFSLYFFNCVTVHSINRSPFSPFIDTFGQFKGEGSETVVVRRPEGHSAQEGQEWERVSILHGFRPGHGEAFNAEPLVLEEV